MVGRPATAFLILVLLSSPQPAAAVDVPLGSDLYRLLDRLWAEGRVDGYWPGTLPVTAEEARDILSGLEGVAGQVTLPAAAGLLMEAEVRVEGGDEGFVGVNSSGIAAAPGPVAGAGFVARRWSAGLSGRFRLPVGDQGPSAVEMYGQAGWRSLRLTVGREAMWWGPGRRGDLFLTNNAAPLEVVRLQTYPGFRLPWVLGSLGEVRAWFFLSRLEEDRGGYVPEPVFGGLKISTSPHRNLVLSLTRTFLFGGGGREEDLGALVDALLARDGSDGDPNVIGNQIAGLSAVWRIPARALPAVVYAEAAGEDEANYQPSGWGFLAGVYFPRLGPSGRLDARLEAATTDMPGRPSAWYSHADYPYVYRDRILGHAMGNDAHDLFTEVGFNPTATSRVAVAAGMTYRYVSTASVNLGRTLTVRAGERLGEGSRVSVEYHRETWDKVPEYGEEGERFALTLQTAL